MKSPSAEVHDLLHIASDSAGMPTLARPHWMKETFANCPWAVALREPARDNLIAVGIRGAARNERWGCVVRRDSIRQIVRPEDLVARSARCALRTPALVALEQLRERWRNLALPWGPTGSVGFELATGCCVTTATSDLDIVIRASTSIDREYARFLSNRAAGLEVISDIRVEAPRCGFSLEEYVRTSSRRIVLRYPEGARLSDDPWQDSGPIEGQNL